MAVAVVTVRRPVHRTRIVSRGGEDATKIDELLKVDAERRKAETELQQLQSERNRLSKEIGGKKSRGEATKDWEAEVRKIGDKIVVNTEESKYLSRSDD